MFPINSFYRRTGGFKLHRLRFFYESNCKIIEKLILDKTQKITLKTTRKLKVNPQPNYATVWIEFYLLISFE